MGLGVDFGDRASGDFVSVAGETFFGNLIGRTVLNDIHGLMVYEDNDNPMFMNSGSFSWIQGVTPDALVRTLAKAQERELEFAQLEKVSYDLFSAALSESNPDARFMMLMMAYETLLADTDRPEAVQNLVAQFVQMTEAAGLGDGDKRSLLGSLDRLRYESIGQSGRKLASTLGDRLYGERTGSRFFTECYTVRSDLAHGNFPRPSRSDVARSASALQDFVSDILSRSLLDFDWWREE